ncbi:MAG: CapA family protein [Oscillospiraceae bacterium]|nr:CapA family protein [Oscillospiraceae bacterium]
MTPDRDELNRRRRLREEQRRKRKAQQRRFYIRLCLAAVVLIACGAAIFLLSRGNEQTPAEPTVSGTEAPVYQADVLEETEAPTEADKSSRTKAPTVIHLAAAGDLNITDKVVWSGQTSGDFDYTKAFMDVAPVLSEADISVLNFEGIVCGAPYGSTSSSAPQKMLEGLKAAGVDLLQAANSQSMTNGMNGLLSTLNNIRAAGLEPVGAFSSAEEFKKAKGYTICEVSGIKIAFVAFTKGMDGRGMPTGSEDCINLLYTDYATTYQEVDTAGITKILRSVASEKPDLTVALLHWGSEYNDTVSDTQKSIVKLMQKEGVDAIIGTHPHMVHEITYDSVTGQLVAYSLGDFFGDGTRGGTNYSIILDLEITKDNETGETKITDYGYTPIYTLSEEECDGDRRVVRIDNAIAAYEGNFVDKITEAAYNSMKTALDRISARVSGE